MWNEHHITPLTALLLGETLSRFLFLHHTTQNEHPNIHPIPQRKQERSKKLEEKKVYIQLHEAMEALLHICRDGCRTIGPRDKALKGSQVACNFPACKGLETLTRHFSSCKTKVRGGCVHCKRMWQLLELHSRMCNDPDYCRVPLCR